MESLETFINIRTEYLAEELVEINKKHLLHNNISGFGMRARVIALLSELRAALFPTLYEQNISADEICSTVFARLKEASTQLAAIVQDVLINSCYHKNEQDCDPADCTKRSEEVTISFMSELIEIRRLLTMDISAAYEGDPAAPNVEEILLSYPSIEAVSIYRLAHALYLKEVPLIPRMMTEYAHQMTGIDIHPGATIGTHFFIDHGTGVVIGQTAVLGNHVKLYQGVTLGAKSFAVDEDGALIKGIKRHPNIEDYVVIYAGATILGGDVSIGHHSVIGGNVWLTESVEPYSMVYTSMPKPKIRVKEL